MLVSYGFAPTLVKQLESQNRTAEVYFMFRRNGTRQFSNSFFFDLRPIEGEFYTYEVVFELFQTLEEDKFETLKDPRKLFFKTINIDDATPYIENLMENFQKNHHLTSREIYLKNSKTDKSQSAFELEVDDGLFRQHYFQVRDY